MQEEIKYPPDMEGFPKVTDALMEMINTFPGLNEGEEFVFSMMPEDYGLSVIATSGSFIIEEHESITGHVWQMCSYPFMVVSRASGLSSKRKISMKEWMDTLAEWLCRKTVTIDGQEYKLKKWPVLTDDREIRYIVRQTPAYLGGINEDKSENWVMDMVIQYRNEFDR